MSSVESFKSSVMNAVLINVPTGIILIKIVKARFDVLLKERIAESCFYLYHPLTWVDLQSD